MSEVDGCVMLCEYSVSELLVSESVCKDLSKISKGV